MTLQVGTKQAFMNAITSHNEKYMQTNQVNFANSGQDDIVVSGLADALDYRNSLQGGITAINLSRCSLSLDFFNGAQIYVNGWLYGMAGSLVDVIWVILYTRITQFNEDGSVQIIDS